MFLVGLQLIQLLLMIYKYTFRRQSFFDTLLPILHPARLCQPYFKDIPLQAFHLYQELLVERMFSI